MKLTAEIISWVFLPLFMPVLAVSLAFYVPSEQDFFNNTDCLYATYPPLKSAVFWFFVVFCVVMPGISFLIMKWSGFLSSIEMTHKKERDLPILVMMSYCLFLYFIFYTKIGNMEVSKFIFSLPLSGVFVTLAFFFLNRWKKLSIHAASTGILTGFILAYILSMSQYQLWVFIVSILISGVVMTARLYLKKHDLTEVILGWLVGTVLTFGINYLY